MVLRLLRLLFLIRQTLLFRRGFLLMLEVPYKYGRQRVYVSVEELSASVLELTATAELNEVYF